MPSLRTDALFGALMRVSNQAYIARPADIAKAFSEPVSFTCFFPVGAAVRRGLVSIVENIAVPENLLEFPVFRSGIADSTMGKVRDWWLWDGENEWKVGKITDEQRRYPIRGVWNDTMLIERIEGGWTPETDQT
jgi:hypothetical protein